LTFYKVFEKIREKLWKTILKDIVQKALWIPTMLTGTLIYLYLNYSVTGNPFQFLIYQKEVWGQKSQYFGTSVSQIFERAFTSNQTNFIRVTIWLPEFFIFIGFVLLLIIGFRRHNPKYLLYLIAYTILSYSPTWLLSGGRYMTVALPMFFILGEISHKNKKLEKIITISFSMLFGIYLLAYLNSKQVL
jgi:hypothetical protein